MTYSGECPTPSRQLLLLLAGMELLYLSGRIGLQRVGPAFLLWYFVDLCYLLLTVLLKAPIELLLYQVPLMLASHTLGLQCSFLMCLFLC